MARVVSATCPTCNADHSIIDRGWSSAWSSAGPVISPCSECCKRTSKDTIFAALSSAHAAAATLNSAHVLDPVGRLLAGPDPGDASTLIDRAERKVMRALLVATLPGGEVAYWNLVEAEVKS